MLISKNNGYTLMITLMLLMILTTLTIEHMQRFHDLLYSSKDLLTRQHLISKKKQRINTLLEAPENIISLCAIHTDIEFDNIDWWQRNACVYAEKNINFYYVIEDLNQDTCASIADQNTIAHYYRLTVLALPKKLNRLRTVLQATFIEPEESDLICQQTKRIVSMGLQSISEP